MSPSEHDQQPPPGSGPQPPAWTELPAPARSEVPPLARSEGRPSARSDAWPPARSEVRPPAGPDVPPLAGSDPGPFTPPAGYPLPTPHAWPAEHGPLALAPAPPPATAPAARRLRRSLPERPVPYHQLLRGPRYRWWRPLLCLVLAAGLSLVGAIAALVPILVVGVISGADPAAFLERDVLALDNPGPSAFAYVNLTLIALIPATLLATWIVHGVRPGFVFSVAGRIRWRWLARCLVVLFPIWAVYLGLAFLVEPPAASPGPPQWPFILVLVLLLTPLQAAAEEVFFRGLILQNVGGWFRRPLVGLVVSVAVSAVVFATGHLSFDPWVLGSIACLAVAAGVAAWRTGGLEAGIAMHASNNLLIFGSVLIFGGWQDVFVGEDTTGTPLMLVMEILVHGTALALVLWQSRRLGLVRAFQPAASPG